MLLKKDPEELGLHDSQALLCAYLPRHPPATVRSYRSLGHVLVHLRRLHDLQLQQRPVLRLRELVGTSDGADTCEDHCSTA